MRTFLTICICAMVSAGIYGFVDMAVDVKNGTMIEYERGETNNEKAVTVSRLRKGMEPRQNGISKNAAGFDLRDKLIKAKSVKKETPVSLTVTDFVSKSYSRGDPGEYEEMVYSTTVLDLPSTSSTDSLINDGAVSSGAAFTSDEGSLVKKPFKIPNPAEETPLTTVKVDSVPQISTGKEGIDWSLYSRGAPRKKLPVKVVKTTTSDSMIVVTDKKDEL